MPDRKTEILDVAEDLLLSRGYCAFSYQDIADRLGIKKASLHHHFATKEDLGVALCERFSSYNAVLAHDCAERGDSPRQMLDRFLERSASLAQAGDRCCPAGVLSAEYNALPPRMRALVDELFASAHRSISEMLERGRAAGEFTFEGEVSDQAWLFLSILPGAVLQARVHGAEVYAAAVRQFRASLVS